MFCIFCCLFFYCPLEIHGCMGSMQKGRLQQALRRGWGSPPWITQSPASHALPMDSLQKRTRGHDHHIEVDGRIARRRHHGASAEEATRATFQEPSGLTQSSRPRRALGTPETGLRPTDGSSRRTTRDQGQGQRPHIANGPGRVKPSTPKANRYYSHQARRTKHHT